VELGCGNGRDSFFFAEKGNNVIGIDQSDTVIGINNARVPEFIVGGKLQFVADDFTKPNLAKYAAVKANVVYSRFTLHSITEDEQANVVSWVYDYLPPGGLFLIECRTKNDPMLTKGKRLSENEAVTDHYRRFLDASAFLSLVLAKGFKARYFIESDNLAVFKDDNPVVARYVLTK